MPSALDHVRLVLAAADTGAPLPRATVEWMAAGLRAVQWDPRRRLEPALGITSRGGVGGMSRQQRQDARDRMLQELRTRFYPGLVDPLPAARAILNLRDAMVRRGGGLDTEAEILLDGIMHLGSPIPGEKHLARILG